MKPERDRGYLAYALLIIFPVLASAQSPAAQFPRIGYLVWSSCERVLDANSSSMRGFRELGYTPGGNITIECRSAGKDYNGITPAVTELLGLGIDVLVAPSHPLARALHDATDTIPIVAILSGDPVGSGLARSLAKPSGNLTGLTYYATELTGKRLDLLMKAIPGVTMVDVLANPNVSYLPFEEDTVRAARRLGVKVRIRRVSEPAELAIVFTTMKAESAQAVFVLPDLMFATEAPRIAALALDHGLPTMSWGYWFANAGCLMAYSARYPELGHRLTYYVDRILKGAKPGDLPIEQPANFEFSINLKTAKALGLALPQSLLLRADRFIE